MTTDDLRRSIQLHYALADRASSKGYMEYLRSVVIDSAPKPRLFREVAAPFQWYRNELIRGPLESVCGFDETYDGPRYVYCELPRGCDKTSQTARMFNWILAYSRKPQRMYACAADKDQAALIRDHMEAELKLNPFLRGKVQILRNVAWGRGGSVEFLASDADSSHGKTPTLICIDEFTHLNRDRGKAFFEAIFTAKDKRKDCVVLITSNAGTIGSWQWQFRELVRQSPYWKFYASEAGTHPAPWMDAASMDEAAKMISPTEAKRLLKNIWINPGEDNGYLQLDECERCVDLNLKPALFGSRYVRYFAAVDYGPKRDRTALSVLHRESDGRIVVDRLDTFHRPSGTVQVSEVERWCEYTKKHFPLVEFTFDKYEMEGTLQKYEQQRWKVTRFEPRGGKSNYEMAANLRSLVLNGKIFWPPDIGRITYPFIPSDPSIVVADLVNDTFEKELSDLLIRETANGFRFDHSSGRHDDRAVAVGMAALAAVNAELPPPALQPPAAFEPPTADFRSAPFKQPFGLFGINS